MMGTRANDSSAEAAPSRRTSVPWVVSRHLLVAQAVSAALTSVGVVVDAVPWDVVDDAVDQPDGDALRPDVLVVLDDVSTPAAVAGINHLSHGLAARVVVVTSQPQNIWWGGIVESDAVEVVGAADSVQQVADLVRRFVAGETLMEPEQRASLRAGWARAVESRRRLVDLVATLSPKELRVLELLAMGYRVSEIGQLLEVSSSTVRSHVKSLRGKLGVHNQLAAVAMLIQLREAGMPGTLVPRPRPRTH